MKAVKVECVLKAGSLTKPNAKGHYIVVVGVPKDEEGEFKHTKLGRALPEDIKVLNFTKHWCVTIKQDTQPEVYGDVRLNRPVHITFKNNQIIQIEG